MKKYLWLFMLMFLLLMGCSDINKVEKIVIGIDDDFAPMSYYNEQGDLVGFDIDLATEAAKRMGVLVEFKPIDWDGKRTAINSGTIDMIWNGLDITENARST